MHIHPLAIAHHPICGRYDDHVVMIWERRACAGCLGTYPAMLVTFAIVLLFTDGGRDEIALLTGTALAAFGAALGTRAMAKRFDRMKFVSRALRGVVGGIGLALLVRHPFETMVIALWALIAGYIGFRIWRGWNSFFDRCDDCAWTFPHCSGSGDPRYGTRSPRSRHQQRRLSKDIPR